MRNFSQGAVRAMWLSWPVSSAAWWTVKHFLCSHLREDSTVWQESCWGPRICVYYVSQNSVGPTNDYFDYFVERYWVLTAMEFWIPQQDKDGFNACCHCPFYTQDVKDLRRPALLLWRCEYICQTVWNLSSCWIPTDPGTVCASPTSVKLLWYLISIRPWFY
jgi:hypothetical protein